MEHNESFNNLPDTSPQTARLIEVLTSLEAHIKKQNSLKRSFLKGIMYGLGTVIGATVLVALFGGFAVTVLNMFTDTDLSQEQLLD